jgi:hypothetical protein
VQLVHEDFLDWQRPVLTEQKAHELLGAHPLSSNVTFFSFAWATFIDQAEWGLVEDKKKLLNKLDVLTKNYKFDDAFTVCQHDRFHIILPLLKSLGIKTLFASHMVEGDGLTTAKYFHQHDPNLPNTIDGIKIEPIFLWPVNIGEANKEKDLLYSFIGSHNDQYVSDIRRKIFQDKHPRNAIVIERKGWQFDVDVYQKQVKKQKASRVQEYLNKEKSKFYKEALTRSRFSLCPSGSGPNSIRFLESLGSGAIPVILADNMMFPEINGINWDDCIIKVPEKDYNKLRKTLSLISANQEDELRQKGLEVYKKCSGENFVQNIREHYNES